MPPSSPSLFELLFKFPSAAFARGDLELGVSRTMAIPLLLGAVAVVLLAAATYARTGSKASRADRAVLAGMRGVAVALLLFCLLRPVLVVSAAVPRRNTVAILVDDSRSMRIGDWNGRPRHAFVDSAFAPQAPLVTALGEQFNLRFYRFSALAERSQGVADQRYAGARTSLGAALDRARQDLADVPLAGFVVVSDGADNAPGALTEPLLALRARGVPVSAVGLGRETFDADVEVARVEAPRTALKGTAMAVDVVLRHSGLGGSTVPVVVEDGGRIVARREVTLPPTGEATPVRVLVPAAEAGARHLAVRVPGRRGEAVVENNERQALVVVADRREKVLYVEGEPRFELKFLRRAVADDENLHLVALQRTAENKYLRLGVDDSLDLASGFPTTREELFGYRAVILGSVEASTFTPDQLRMLADFVSERGGGLLMLGGRHSFAEGGYARTALADVLPVVLDGVGRDSASVAEVSVQLTPAGASTPSLQLAADERASAARWRMLPPLTAVNDVRRAKPGATVLLTGAAGAERSAAGAGGRRVVLASQRYGRGRAAAFAVQDSWLWQMHADMAVDDMTHELFWRQMLRWLVSGAPGVVTVTPSTDRPVPGEAVTLRAEVRDAEFRSVNGGTVVAHVTAPSGATADVPLEWSVERDGEYRATFTPREAGVHEVRVEARRPGADTAMADPVFVEAAEPQDEYFDAAMRAPLLKRIAAETGGRFYTPATVRTLAEDLRFTRSGVTVTERRELWDMPIVFLLLGSLVAGEWAYRRARGLA